jgi:tryptophan synthase alpha subunit
VVIGSRIVQEIEDSNDDDLINNIRNLMAEIKSSITKVREISG